MRPIGNGRPNSGTNARASDLTGEGLDGRFKALRERGSGKAAINHEWKTGPGAFRRISVQRKGAGRLARTKD